jgi:hypothetical protein
MMIVAYLSGWYPLSSTDIDRETCRQGYGDAAEPCVWFTRDALVRGMQRSNWQSIDTSCTTVFSNRSLALQEAVFAPFALELTRNKWQIWNVQKTAQEMSLRGVEERRTL